MNFIETKIKNVRAPGGPFLSCFATHLVWTFGFFVIIRVIQTSILEPFKTFLLCLNKISHWSLWYWFLKSCVWPKNLNIISHGLEITNENFCDNFASGQKKTNKAEKLSQARPGPAGCWFWIKKILLFWFWCKDRQGGLARGSWDWDWSWVIKLIMPGVVLWCCGETTQAQETSGQSPQPLEMTW